jgi:LmbE family N-acetylglucosaminyl deacetylase
MAEAVGRAMPALRAFDHAWCFGKAALLRPELNAMAYRRDAPEGGCAVILVPHMDDEAIGCGGLIRRLHDRGTRVVCVYFTDGAAGRIGAERAAWSRRRYDESRAAASILGIDRLVFLGWPDGELEPGPGLQDGLLEVVRAERPALVFLPYPFDPHADHRAVFATFAALAGRPELKEIAAYLYQVRAPIPWPAVSLVLDITAQLPAKRDAMSRFVSQPRSTFELSLHLASCQRFLVGWRPAAVEVFAALDVTRMSSAVYREPVVAPPANSFRVAGRRAIRRGRPLANPDGHGIGTVHV